MVSDLRLIHQKFLNLDPINSLKKSKYKKLDVYLNLMYLSDWYQNDKLIKKLLNT